MGLGSVMMGPRNEQVAQFVGLVTLQKLDLLGAGRPDVNVEACQTDNPGGEGLDDVDSLNLGQGQPVGFVGDEAVLDAHLVLVDMESRGRPHEGADNDLQDGHDDDDAAADSEVAEGQ